MLSLRQWTFVRGSTLEDTDGRRARPQRRHLRTGRRLEHPQRRVWGRWTTISASPCCVASCTGPARPPGRLPAAALRPTPDTDSRAEHGRHRDDPRWADHDHARPRRGRAHRTARIAGARAPLPAPAGHRQGRVAARRPQGRYRHHRRAPTRRLKPSLITRQAALLALAARLPAPILAERIGIQPRTKREVLVRHAARELGTFRLLLASLDTPRRWAAQLRTSFLLLDPSQPLIAGVGN